MRLVLDTNVLVAAFLSRGHCHELLEHAARAHELFTSELILDELGGTLAKKFRIPDDDVAEVLSLLRSRMQPVDPQPLPEPVCRDPDDDQVLATALAAAADCLVTGDRDLLDLGEHEGVAIIRPAAFWELQGRVEEGSGRP